MSCTEIIPWPLKSHSIPRVFVAGETYHASFAADRTPYDRYPGDPNNPLEPTAWLRGMIIPFVDPDSVIVNGVHTPPDAIDQIIFRVPGYGWESLGSVDVQFRILPNTKGDSEPLTVTLLGTAVQGGWYADFCVTYLPARPKAPDEDERNKTKDDCLEWLVNFLSQFGVNLDGCQTLRFLDQVMDDPFGAFAGLAARAYKSLNYSNSPGSMGWGWSLGAHAKVATNDKGDLLFLSGGSFQRWSLQNGKYLPAHRDNDIEARKNLDDTFDLTLPDQTMLHFETIASGGRLLTKADRNGNSVTFQYEQGTEGDIVSATDGKGRTLQFVHRPDGQPEVLREIHGAHAREFRYEYNSSGPHAGRLSGTLNGEGERTSFTYDSKGRLYQVINPRGIIDLQLSYYDSGENIDKVHTQTVSIDPATGQGQLRNAFFYDMAKLTMTVETEDLTEFGVEPSNRLRRYVFRYDDRHNVVESRDPLGNVYQYEYHDPVNPYLVTRVIDPNLSKTGYKYNKFGNLIETTDAQKNVTKLKYYEDFYPNRETKPSHKNLLYEVHRPSVHVFENGVKVQKTYPPICYRYDDRGNLHQVVHHVFTEASKKYEEVVTTLERNVRGQVKSIADPDGNTVGISYHANGNIDAITTPASLDYKELTTSLLYHDQQFDRLVGARYPWGTPRAYSFDDEERLREVTIGDGPYAGFYAKFLYEKGLVTDVLAPPNRRSERDADAAPVRGADADAKRRTHYVYDSASRLEKVFSDVPLDAPHSEILQMFEKMRVRVRHDGLSQLRQMVRRISIDGVDRDQVTTYGYDELSRLVETKDPRANDDSRVNPSRMEPSPFCKESKYVSAAGRETTVTTDALCRLASVSYKNEGDTIFEHDELHRLIRVQQPGGTPAKYRSGGYSRSRYSGPLEEKEERTFEYDALDRLVRVNFPDGNFIRYGYSPGGKLKSVIDVHGRETSYEYHDDGRLFEVKFGGMKFEYNYDDFGRLRCLKYPPSTGIVAHYTWTPGGELESIDYRQSLEAIPEKGEPVSTSLRRLTYEYDAAGNRVNMVDSANDGRVATTWEYWYDALNRLEWVCQDGLPVRRYRFDQSDNRSELQFFEHGNLKETYSYKYNLGDRLEEVSRGPEALLKFAYDDDGNTLVREEVGSRTDDYSWSDAGALKSILTKVPGEPNTTIRNAYDAGRIRKRKLADDGTQTDYYYSGLPALSETVTPPSGEPSKRSYLVGHQVLGYFEGGSFRLFLPDAIGSVRELVDAEGALRASYTYDEYGASSDSSRFGPFSLPAEASIRYLRIRWYDPTHGRFLSKDPLRFQHPYNYANENPINRTDPTGLAPGLDIPISNMSRYIPPAVQQTLTAEARFAMAKRFVELYNKRADFGAGYDQELAAVNAHPLIMGGPGYWNLWFNPFLWLQPRHESHVVQHRWTEVHPRNVCPERYGGKFDRVDIVNLGGLLVHEGWHYVYPDYKHVADLATDPMTLEFDSPMKDRLGKFAAGLSDDDWAYIEGR